MPQEKCIICHGAGERTCPICKGKGKVPDKEFRGFILSESMRPKKTCPECGGTGKILCRACNGTGVIIT